MGWDEWIRGVEVEPSLYAADFTNLGTQISRVLDAGARVFHLDVGDGRFIEPITIGPIVLQSIAPLIRQAGGVVDSHLMVVEPERHFAQIARAGGESVTFHVEACDDPARAIALARSLGLGVGIAFNPETPVENALAAAESVDLVLCMSIHPGYSGQEFMLSALERVAALRAALPSGVHVQVDGGVNAETIAAVRQAGANLLVAGSAIFGRADVGESYSRLAELAAVTPAAEDVPPVVELRGGGPGVDGQAVTGSWPPWSRDGTVWAELTGRREVSNPPRSRPRWNPLACSSLAG